MKMYWPVPAKIAIVPSDVAWQVTDPLDDHIELVAIEDGFELVFIGCIRPQYPLLADVCRQL